MDQPRERSAYLLDVVAAVSTLAQEAVALRARVAVLEHANEGLMSDWQTATTKLQEAMARLVEYDEAEEMLKRPVLVSDEPQ